jgi:hypothetical protein
LASQSLTQAKTGLEWGTHRLFFLNAFIFRQFLCFRENQNPHFWQNRPEVGHPFRFISVSFLISN